MYGQCIKVIDCKSHSRGDDPDDRKNWENPTFYPTIDMFRKFKQNWKKYDAHFCIFAVSTDEITKSRGYFLLFDLPSLSEKKGRVLGCLTFMIIFLMVFRNYIKIRLPLIIKSSLF